MTKYILHGGFTRSDNELNRTFYAEMVRDVPEGGNVLLIYFASDDADVPQKSKEDSESLIKQAEGKNITITIASKENLIEEIKAAHSIYLRGGDTDKLLEILKQYPNLSSLFEGKTVAGSSAGAYVLSTLYYSNLVGTIEEGLGVLPIRTVCHYNSERFPNLGDAVELMKGKQEDLELVVLKDCEWQILNV